MKNKNWKHIGILVCSTTYLLSLSGCASTASDRYQVLMKSEKCQGSLSLINYSAAKTLTVGTAAEGELNEESCLLQATSRTGYSVFRFRATKEKMALVVRADPKSRGVGFGGQHTLIVPEISVLATPNATPMRFINNGLEIDHTIWRDKYNYTFVLNGLTPNEDYFLVVTSNNERLGSRLTQQTVPTYAAGIVINLDNSVFVGPFGTFDLMLNP